MICRLTLLSRIYIFCFRFCFKVHHLTRKMKHLMLLDPSVMILKTDCVCNWQAKQTDLKKILKKQNRIKQNKVKSVWSFFFLYHRSCLYLYIANFKLLHLHLMVIVSKYFHSNNCSSAQDRFTLKIIFFFLYLFLLLLSSASHKSVDTRKTLCVISNSILDVLLVIASQQPPPPIHSLLFSVALILFQVLLFFKIKSSLTDALIYMPARSQRWKKDRERKKRKLSVTSAQFYFTNRLWVSAVDRLIRFGRVIFIASTGTCSLFNKMLQIKNSIENISISKWNFPRT